MTMNQQMSVSVRALLSKATNNTNDPTPGYVYHELIEHCKSYPKTAQPIISYLLKKLDREPVVRLKTIKTLKFMCENSSHEFTRCLSHHTDILKSCLHLDDVDEYHRSLISQEIENLLQILYSGSYKPSLATIYPQRSNDCNNGNDTTYQPNSVINTHFNHANFNAKGYGNTNYISDRKGVSQSTTKRAISYIQNLANRYVPPKILDHVERIGSIVVEKAKTATSSFNTTFNSQQPSPIRMPNTNFNTTIAQIKGNKENFEKEEAVFLEAMKTGGVMVAPSTQVIELMSKKASKLDPRGIAAAVIKCLSEPDIKNGKSYCRALCLLEGLLKSEYLSNEQNQILSDYIIEHGLECLYRCKVSPPLRKTSERVLRLLKLQGPDDILDTDISELDYKEDKKESLITFSNSPVGINKNLLDLSPTSSNQKTNNLDFLNGKLLSTNANTFAVANTEFDMLDFGTAKSDNICNGDVYDKITESSNNNFLGDISNNDLFNFIEKELEISK